MSLQVGFAAVDITPPVGTRKIGMKRLLHGQVIRDPLHARAAVFRGAETSLALVQLDTLSIRWTQVDRVRRRLSELHPDFPAANVMIAATHNHAGPAVANVGEVARDDDYVAWLETQVVGLLSAAIAAAQPAEVALGWTFEWQVGYNRRTVMRDGYVKTQVRFPDNADALCLEGPIDPEVGVLAVRAKAGGQLLGVLVQFACHPTHYGGGDNFSAGYPGELARLLAAAGVPQMVYLNGAGGNIIHFDMETGESIELEAAAQRLAEDVQRVLAGDLVWRDDVALAVAATTLQLPFREVTDAELHGTVRGAQRFGPDVDERGNPACAERIRSMGTQPAEVQVLTIGDLDIVATPCEFFVELGLDIKQRVHPRHVWIAGQANGMVGYVPHRAGYARGGYETTFCGCSRLAPGCGEQIADAAVQLIQQRPV